MEVEPRRNESDCGLIRYTTSILWKWFGYFRGDKKQIKWSAKYVGGYGKHHKSSPSSDKLLSRDQIESGKMCAHVGPHTQPKVVLVGF